MKTMLLFLALAGVLAAANSNTSAATWETVSTGSAKVAVPKGWRNMDGIENTMPVYRLGDGIGVPVVDETGAPLQIGLVVEKLPPAKKSTEALAREAVKDAMKDPRLQLVGKESVESVTLSDQTTATLETTEVIKAGSRRKLQMQLYAKDSRGQVWVVTGFLVGGKTSQWPTPRSRLGAWLRAHIVSLTLTGTAIDSKRLQAAYQDRDK